MPEQTVSLRRAVEVNGQGRGLSTMLMKESFRMNIAVALLIGVILSIAIPTVMYFFEIFRYKDESISLLSNFVEKELEDEPWVQLTDPVKKERLSGKITAFMQLSNLIEFKIWRDNGVLFYSFHDPDMAGKKFEINEDLEETLKKGEASAEVVDPARKTESGRLANHAKLFEVYVPIKKQGRVLGAAYLMLGRSYFDTVRSLFKALEIRDMETEGHSQRVVELSMYFGEKIYLEMADRQKLLLGACLHDIGKIGIPDNILLKKGRLTEDERQVMMTHIMKGYEFIKDVETLKLAADVVLCHHEKWDGSGYGKGLKGEDIPVAARIFALVDVYDALRNKRPYKEAISFDDTREIINGSSGTRFDPGLVAVFNSMSAEEIEQVYQKNPS